MSQSDFSFVVGRLAEIAEKTPDVLDGVGFALTPDRGQGRKMILMFPSRRISSVVGLREFSEAINAITTAHDVDVAGLLARIPLKVQHINDNSIPEEEELVPSTLLYIDRKYGDMRLWVGDTLNKDTAETDLKELGPPSALTNFLPSLFPMESYGIPIAEA